jgi:hypothetical protein
VKQDSVGGNDEGRGRRRSENSALDAGGDGLATAGSRKPSHQDRWRCVDDGRGDGNGTLHCIILLPTVFFFRHPAISSSSSFRKLQRVMQMSTRTQPPQYTHSPQPRTGGGVPSSRVSGTQRSETHDSLVLTLSSATWAKDLPHPPGPSLRKHRLCTRQRRR